MVQSLANISDQNFYVGTSADFEDFSEKFNLSLVSNQTVFFLELDTKVIHYSDEGEWKVYGEPDETT